MVYRSLQTFYGAFAVADPDFAGTECIFASDRQTIVSNIFLSKREKYHEKT
jgi:hypothetical protein